MLKAIFLDRDGTLNPDPGYISDPDDYELFPGAGEALVRLKKAGYLLILITNQSGISRGLINRQQLELVHKKLQSLLAAFGVSLDAIYYCPHHPDFPPVNGVSVCNCRKPQPGMVLQAIKDFNIDIKSSFFIGDRSSDVKIALRSEVKPIFIGKTPLPGYEAVPTFADLQAAVDWLLVETVDKV